MLKKKTLKYTEENREIVGNTYGYLWFNGMCTRHILQNYNITL